MLITLDLLASRCIGRYCQLIITYFPHHMSDNLLTLQRKNDEIGKMYDGVLVHLGGDIDFSTEEMLYLKEVIPMFWDFIEKQIKFNLEEQESIWMIPHFKKELVSLNNLYDQLTEKLNDGK